MNVLSSPFNRGPQGATSHIPGFLALVNGLLCIEGHWEEHIAHSVLRLWHHEFSAPLEVPCIPIVLSLIIDTLAQVEASEITCSIIEYANHLAKRLHERKLAILVISEAWGKILASNPHGEGGKSSISVCYVGRRIRVVSHSHVGDSRLCPLGQIVTPSQFTWRLAQIPSRFQVLPPFFGR